MDATTYSALGLDVDAHAKLDENPNGPSWENDTSHDHPCSLPPESAERVEGCPRGVVVEHAGYESLTFAGTTRDWWVYVPAQYSADKEANLLVFQDGAAYLGETQEGQAPPDPAVKDGRQVQAAVALDVVEAEEKGPQEGRFSLEDYPEKLAMMTYLKPLRNTGKS